MSTNHHFEHAPYRIDPVNIVDSFPTDQMSTRKRPLAELSQPVSHPTPSRYAPSTPHARRALYERNSAKRSARTARSVNKTGSVANNSTTEANTNLVDLIRPDGSARNILRHFARLTAPVTQKRISTPVGKAVDQENANPDADGDDDSILTVRPHLSIHLEDSIEDDSELVVAPTPSVLPDDYDDDDDDDEPPTLTFQNITRAASEGADRRRSRLSLADRTAADIEDDGEEQEGDATIMTERGRRALSEEATGRFSRYSFGSIRMSDFGSELEIRRESDRQQKLVELESEDDYHVVDGSVLLDLGGETEDLRRLQRSPSGEGLVNDSIHIADLGDDTFQLPMPDDEVVEHTEAERTAINAVPRPMANTSPVRSASSDEESLRTDRPETVPDDDDAPTLRQQTQLELANRNAQASRRKKLKLTRHGTVVPSLPSSLIRRVAAETQTTQGKRKPKFGRDHVKALEQATEWFFEQIGEDLAAYSSHGRRRKRVDDDDVLLLLRRHKMLASNGELKKLAKDWLPKEMLAEIDFPDDL